NRERRLAAGISSLNKADCRVESGIRNRVSRNADVSQLNITVNSLLAEADGVDGQPLVEQSIHRARVDPRSLRPTRIFSPVGQQDDRSNRNIGRFGHELPEAIADVCGRSIWLNFLQ